MNILRQVIFILSIIFICLSMYSLTIGQMTHFEFVDWKARQNYYYLFVLFGVPLALILTLFKTISKKYKPITNWWTAGLTITGSIVSFFVVFFLFFRLGWGHWVNESVLYRQKENHNLTINDQIWDAGGLGFGSQRTVELKPFLIYLNRVTEIDTMTINKNEWKFVNEKCYQKFQ
jgi:prolipoprotein diacylglyceryltransferase